MIKLPHPEFAGLIQAIKRDAVETRVATVAGTELHYSVFRSGDEAPDVAFYDEDGAIFVAEDLVDADPRSADLTAYHEHVEIRHKLAGRSHAYAHRRAYVEELLAAKALFSGPGELSNYLRRRVGGYPEWKVPDPDGLAARLHGILSVDRPRKGELLQAVTDSHLKAGVAWGVGGCSTRQEARRWDPRPETRRISSRRGTARSRSATRGWRGTSHGPGCGGWRTCSPGCPKDP